MYAFISYSHQDRVVASSIKKCLEAEGVDSFMAHEDIDVSSEWATRILKEIQEADIYISLWSKNYLESAWCMQESGIAAFRKDMTEIPLSIDQSTIPRGAASPIQSGKVDSSNITIYDLLPGLIKHDYTFGLKRVISSSNFNEAGLNFDLIAPRLKNLGDDKLINFLEQISGNSQVYNSWKCIERYIPLFEKYKHRLSKETEKILQKAIDEYK